MAGLNDFAKRIDRIAVQVEGNVERAVKECANAVVRNVISNTPVDTGRARSNWTAQMDEAFAGLFPATMPGEKGSTADANAVAAIEAAEQVIETFDIAKNGSIHIANNLPYIRALNDGHSKHAPADFVRLAVLDGLATVRGATIVED